MAEKGITVNDNIRQWRFLICRVGRRAECVESQNQHVKSRAAKCAPIRMSMLVLKTQCAGLHPPREWLGRSCRRKDSWDGVGFGSIQNSAIVPAFDLRGGEMR